MAAGGEEHRQPEQHQQGQVLAEHALRRLFELGSPGHDELVAFVEHVTQRQEDEQRTDGEERRHLAQVAEVADHHDRDDRLVLVDHRDLRAVPGRLSTTPP